MPFRSLRANAGLYILHKEGVPRLEKGSVSFVSSPVPQWDGKSQYGMPSEFVDVSATVGGQPVSFQHLPAWAEIADASGVVVSCSREAISAEIAAIQRAKRDILANRENDERVVEACASILADINPEMAETARRDKETEQLRAELREVKELLSRLTADGKASKKNSYGTND